jgi:hypothetical protein
VLLYTLQNYCLAASNKEQNVITGREGKKGRKEGREERERKRQKNKREREGDGRKKSKERRKRKEGSC